MLLFRSVKEVVEKAQRLRSEGKLDKAISTLESIISDTEEDFEAYLELGSIYVQKERPQDAAIAYRKAMSLLPRRRDEVISSLSEAYPVEAKIPELAEVLLDAYIAKRDLENASRVITPLPPRDLEKLYDKYLKMLKTLEEYTTDAKIVVRSLHARYCLAVISTVKGKLDETHEMLISILKIERGESNIIEGEYKRIINKRRKEGLPYLFLGEFYIFQGMISNAVQAYHDAINLEKSLAENVIERLISLIEKEPKNVMAYECLGDAYLAKGDFKNASDAYGTVVKLDEKKVDSLIPKYKEITRLASKDASGYIALGDLHFRNKKFDLAVTEYAKAAELDRSFKQQIIQKYNDILKIEPDNITVVGYLVDNYVDNNELNKATSILNEAYKTNENLTDEISERLNIILEKDIDHVGALELLAKIFSKKKSYSEAIEVYRHIIKASPQSSNIVLTGIEEILKGNPTNLDARIALGEAYLLSDNTKKSLEEFNFVLQKDKSLSPHVIPFLEKITQKDKDLVEAVMEIYTMLAEKGGETLLTQFALGEAKAEKGDYRGAITQFQKVLELDPTKLDAVTSAYKKILSNNPNASLIQIALADVYFAKGRVDETIDSLRRALSTDPSLFESVIERYQLIAGGDPENISVRHAYIEALYNQRLYDRVLSECDKLIREGKGTGFIYMKAGQSHLEKGELTKAVAHLLKAIDLDQSVLDESLNSLKKIVEIDPGNIAGHYALGRAYRLKKQMDESLQEYATIARLDEKRIDRIIEEIRLLLQQEFKSYKAHFLLADLLIQKGAFDEASLECDRALDLDPSQSIQAIERHKKIFAHDPENPRSSFALGKAYVAQGAFAQATEYLTKAVLGDETLLEPTIREAHRILEKEPDNCEARYVLAQVYLRRGIKEQAIHLLMDICNINPFGADTALASLEKLLQEDLTNQELRYTIAKTYLSRNDFEKATKHFDFLCGEMGEKAELALQHLREIVNSNPENPSSLLSLGKALLRHEQRDEAITLFSKSTLLDSNLRGTVIEILEKAIASGARSGETYRLLGTLYLENKSVLKAAESFLAGIKNSKDRLEAAKLYLYLSQSLLSLGDKRKSKESLAQANRLSPSRQELLLELNRLRERTLQIKLNEIRANSEISQEESKLRQTEILLDLEKYKEAQETLDFEPSDESTRFQQILLKGKMHLNMGNPILAIETLRQFPSYAIPVQKDGLEFIYTLALSYSKAGFPEPAASLYEKILKQNSTFKDAAQKLAKEYEKLAIENLSGKGRILEKTL